MAKVARPHIAYHGPAPTRRNSVPQSGQHPTERYPLPMLCMLMNTPLDCGRSHSGHRIVFISLIIKWRTIYGGTRTACTDRNDFRPLEAR